MPQSNGTIPAGRHAPQTSSHGRAPARWQPATGVMLAPVAVIVALLAWSEPAHGEPEDLILDARLGPLLVRQGFFALETDGVVLLPVVELAEGLGLVAEADSAERRVSGWVLDESRTFSIDLRRMEVSRDGDVLEIGDEDVEDFDLEAFGELYLAMDVLEWLWPVSFTLDYPALSLRIEADEPLPEQQRLERERRRAVALGRSREPEGGPPAPVSYGWLSPPIADIDSRFITGPMAAPESRTRFTIRHDLAGFSARWRGRAAANFDTGETDLLGTVRLERMFGDRDGLPAHTLTLGDIALPAEPLRRRGSPQMRGVVYRNAPPWSESAFDTVPIRGDGPPGWEVEIHRNNQLITFGRIDEDGTYSFDAIPLTFGANRLRIVRYGPQGQTNEEVRVIMIDRAMVPPGDTRVSLALGEAEARMLSAGTPDPERLVASATAAHGLSERVTLLAGVHHRGDRDRSQAHLGGRLALANSQIAMTASLDTDNRRAVGVNTLSRFGTVGLSLGAQWESRFDRDQPSATDRASGSERDGSSTLQEIDGDAPGVAGTDPVQPASPSTPDSKPGYVLDARIDTSARLGPVSLSLLGAVEHERVSDSRPRTRARVQVGASMPRLRMTHTLDRTFLGSGQTRPWRGDVSASTSLAGNRLRGGFSYRIEEGAFRFDSARASVVARVADTWRFAASGTVSPGSRSDTLSLSAERSFERFRFGLDGRLSSNGDHRFGLSLGFSLGPAPDGRYRPTADSQIAQAAVDARIFVDRSGTGTFDAETDVPIQGARLRAGRRAVGPPSDTDGRVRADRFPVGRPVPVSVDERSLADPYWRPAGDGVTVIARPGTVTTVDLPVEETGAIDGVARLASTGTEARGITIRLETLDGTLVDRVSTSFDGFFVFEHVPPGHYRLSLESTRYAMDAPIVVELTADDPFASFSDVPIRLEP